MHGSVQPEELSVETDADTAAPIVEELSLDDIEFDDGAKNPSTSSADPIASQETLSEEGPEPILERCVVVRQADIFAKSRVMNLMKRRSGEGRGAENMCAFQTEKLNASGYF